MILKMQKTVKNWESYWSVKKPGFDYIMRNTTPVFHEKYLKRTDIKPHHVFLDFGCGPGFLIEKLPAENKIIGADISRDYIEFCEEKFRSSENIFFECITEKNSFQTILSKEKPDVIIAISVIQYFENNLVLKKYIDEVKNYSKENKKSIQLIIADIIPQKNSKLIDVFEVFLHSIRKGYFLDFFRFCYEVLHSDYNSKQLKVNKTNPEFFELYAKEHHLKLEFLKNVTVNKNRYSLVFTF